jgi:PAT family beta-lactamase induction signal transducer AmpG
LRAQLIIFICGFISGFTLLISGNTLNFWLSANSIDKTLIGLFSLVSIPYAINFIWAPLLDTIRIPVLHKIFGHRLSWIYLLQFLLAITTYALSLLLSQDNLLQIAICGFCIALFSSSADAVMGALRAELLEEEKQGSVAGVYTFGYRLGMLLSSSGAIGLSAYLQWHTIYKIFAYIICAFPILLCITVGSHDTSAKNPKETKISADKNSFINHIITPLGGTTSVALLLTFLVLYRMPDNFINAMINPFLFAKGFGALEIASVGKFLGIMAAILGGLLGSYVMNKMPIKDSLIIFGIVHAAAHSMFIVQDMVGDNLVILFAVMGFESITGGMAMAAYIAFITSLCKGKYSATQYAFLSAMMGLSRGILPGLSGLVVKAIGWKLFYLSTSLAALPSILLLWYIKRRTQIQGERC